MRRALCMALALLAGCAAAPQPEGPQIESGAIVGNSTDPRNRARIRTELASLYYARGSMNIALEELRLAIAADPNFATAHGMFGLVYMELRENALAQGSFERALSLSPDDPDINHNYGWFLCQTNRENESIKYFMQAVRTKRLDGEFEAAYRYVEILFGGRNPYIEAIERNLAFIKEVLRSESWRMLRRNPPVFAAVPDPVGNMRGLMAGYIRKVWTED